MPPSNEGSWNFGTTSSNEAVHALNITSNKSEQAESSLTDDEVRRFCALLAPNPKQFSGNRNGHRKGPNLFIETVSYDEHGEEHIGTTAPRGVDGTTALLAHFGAGRARMPVAITGYKGPPIRAVSLGYEEGDLVGWFDLDLDGDYPIEIIGPVLEKTFGKGRLVCRSGSGRVGRYRTFGLLAVPLTVRRLNELLTAICTRLGYPPANRALEISPAYKQSRLPGGLGGCQIFDLTTGKPIGKPNQAKLVRTIFDLAPIDLEAEARKIGSDNPGIDTAIPRSRGRFDPDIRRERQRSIPGAKRVLLRRGVTRPGERQKIQLAFVTNCMLDGNSAHDAIPKFDAYIDEGKFDESSDVKLHGRDWLKKQVPRIVRGIYASTRPIGMPDPIPLDGTEIRRMQKIAKRVASEHPEFSEKFVVRFLTKILPIFKGCIAASLSVARIHSKIWQAAGGTHYARLRAACGIFDARSGYKSLKLVLSRVHLGAKPCEARATDWSTSFVFDRDLPAPSYEIARSILVAPNSPPSSDPIVSIAAFPSTSLTPGKAASVRSRSPKDFTRLYVHQLVDPLEIKGSENLPKVSILPLDVPDRIFTEVDMDYPTIDRRLSDEIEGAKRRRTEIKRARSEARNGTLCKPKVPEWRLLSRWSAPGAEHMELDEWIEATATPVKEYQRELRQAKADQRDLFRQHGIQLSLGKAASKRFHELRGILNLDPWN